MTDAKTLSCYRTFTFGYTLVSRTIIRGVVALLIDDLKPKYCVQSIINTVMNSAGSVDCTPM